MLDVEDWAEIRRLHRAEGLSIKEITRRLGVARNTVRSALRSDSPPVFDRKPRPSAVDAVEPAIRQLLEEFPRMPATVIAERIGWERSMTVLKDRVRDLRPLFVGSMAGRRLSRPVRGIKSFVEGVGYWLVATDGGVFTFGDARFRGSAGGLRLDAPIVGIG